MFLENYFVFKYLSITAFFCIGLVGVLNGGGFPCGSAPDIYISVVEFKDWIDKWIKP